MKRLIAPVLIVTLLLPVGRSQIAFGAVQRTSSLPAKPTTVECINYGHQAMELYIRAKAAVGDPLTKAEKELIKGNVSDMCTDDPEQAMIDLNESAKESQAVLKEAQGRKKKPQGDESPAP